MNSKTEIARAQPPAARPGPAARAIIIVLFFFVKKNMVLYCFVLL